MSLARRMALLMAAMVLLALLASLGIHTLAARQALVQELELRNRDGARTLAAALTLQAGNLQAMRELVQAQLGQGVYRRVQLLRPDGSLAIDSTAPTVLRRAPDWFAQVVPVLPPAGEATVHDGAQELGRLRLESRVGWVYDALWDAVSLTAQLMLLLALAGALLATVLLRAWQGPLHATVAQAQALEQGRFVEAPEPRLPELRSLTRSMNAMVRRLREVFAAQAEQVQVLQRQAQLDSVTSLPLRRGFVGRLEQQLGEPGGPGATLILVRVADLDGLNQRLGHEATDRLLAAAAGLLLAYVDRVPGTFAGRLSGGDFGLCLPVAGVAADTAQSLHAALVAAPALHAGGAHIVVGAVDGLQGLGVGAALSAADAVLAQAEAEGGLAVQAQDSIVADPAGARAWREQIGSALAEGRVQLAAWAVLGREGQLIHLACTLRVQLSPGGEYHAAGRWLALARRSRLLPQVDLTAIELALQASAADGRPRAVQLALASLVDSGFVLDVTARLQAAPVAARRLSLEWAGPSNPLESQAVAAAAECWRPCGVRLGVLLGTAQVPELTSLGETGIDYVKLDGRHLQGLSGDGAVRAYAESLVALIHGLGLMVLAQDVSSHEELAALWGLGFDGATGAAVHWAGQAD